MTARRQAARRQEMLDRANAEYAAALGLHDEAGRLVTRFSDDTTSDAYWAAREAEMAASDHLRVADAWRLRCQATLDALMEAAR